MAEKGQNQYWNTEDQTEKLHSDTSWGWQEGGANETDQQQVSGNQPGRCMRGHAPSNRQTGEQMSTGELIESQQNCSEQKNF